MPKHKKLTYYDKYSDKLTNYAERGTKAHGLPNVCTSISSEAKTCYQLSSGNPSDCVCGIELIRTGFNQCLCEIFALYIVISRYMLYLSLKSSKNVLIREMSVPIFFFAWCWSMEKSLYCPLIQHEILCV